MNDNFKLYLTIKSQRLDLAALDPAIVSSLIGAGVDIIDEDGDGQPLHVRYHNKTVIEPKNCWRSGRGPCPDGHCMHESENGLLISETTVQCSWICFFLRAHCKTQICCKAS